MDPTKSESTRTESEILRVKSADYVGYGEWNDIRRAVLEQNVPAGTQFVQYKNRVVPLRWEPLPMVSIALPFGTVEEAKDYIRRTCKSTGGETSSDVLNITPSSAQPTSSADNNPPGDIASGVESAVSNLHILDHSTEQNSGEASDFDSPGLVVSEEPAGRNNNVSDNLQKPAEDENIPEADGGHQDVTEDSFTQKPDWLKKLHSRFEEYKTVPEGSDAEALFSAVKELETAVAEQNSVFQKMDVAADVSTECGAAERRSGDEMTGSPSAERVVGPANESPILKPSPDEIMSCLQGLYSHALQKIKEGPADELEQWQQKARTALSTLKKFKRCAVMAEENNRILQDLIGMGSISAERGTAERHSGKEMTGSPSARRLVGPANGSPVQKPYPDEIIRCLETIYFRVLQNIREGPDDELEQWEQLARKILSILKEQNRIAQVEIGMENISTECGAAEQRCDGENMTGSVSAISSGTSMMTAAAMKKQQMDEKRIQKMTHRDLRTPGTLIHTPFPKNSSDQKDWPNISRAMRRGNVSRSTESFCFEGRLVPIGWRTASLDRLEKECNRRLMLERKESDAEIEGDSSTAGASTTEHDEVEEQEQEEACCDDRLVRLVNRALDAGMRDDPLPAGASTSKEEGEDRTVHSDPASSEAEVFYVPSPTNPSDEEDWVKILPAMKRENVTIAADSFYFEGRWVPIVWKTAIYDRSKEEYVPEDSMDAQLAGDPLAAGASTKAVPDTMEEQKQEQNGSTAHGHQSDSKKKRGPRRRK